MRIVRSLFGVMVTLAIAGVLSADDKYDQSGRFKPTEAEVVAEAVKAAASDAADAQQTLEAVVSRFDAELAQLRQSLKDAEAVNVDLRQRLAESEKELTALNVWKERASVQLATLEKQVADHDVMLRAPTLAEEKPDDAWKDKEADVFCFSPSATWFHCPACVKFHKDSETMVLPFNLIFGEMDQAEAKRLQVPANAKFPLFRIGNKGEAQWYWVWFERGLTQESLVKRFEEVHK